MEGIPIPISISKQSKDIALGIMLAVGGMFTVGVILYRLIQTHSSLNAYAGLSPHQIDAVAAEFSKRCKILSRVAKPLKDGNVRYRGIYLGGEGGACSMPIYYHYIPGKNFEIYPLLWNELWHTNKDRFDFAYGTGKMIYPAA
jgi:hypothetical protein